MQLVANAAAGAQNIQPDLGKKTPLQCSGGTAASLQQRWQREENTQLLFVVTILAQVCSSRSSHSPAGSSRLVTLS